MGKQTLPFSWLEVSNLSDPIISFFVLFTTSDTPGEAILEVLALTQCTHPSCGWIFRDRQLQTETFSVTPSRGKFP